MSNRLCLLLVSSLIFLYVSRASAQEVFGTDNGSIHISSVKGDKVVTAISKQLIVILNYDNATFKLKLDKSTLETGIDSIDKIFRQRIYDYIEFEGKLGIEQVKTEKHPPQDFEVNGYITCSTHYVSVVGKGHMEHLFGEYYSCLLNMTFFINPEKFNLKDTFGEDLTGDLRVDVIQSVLNRQE